MGFPGNRPHGTSIVAPQSEWTGLAGPLQEAGEIACPRLCAALSDAMTKAAEQLFSQGAQAAAALEQAALLDAANFARTRQRGLVEDFRKHFERRYARACRPKSALLTGYTLDFDVNQLRIVAHEPLEETMDPSMVVEAIRNRCAGSLHELAKPFRDLLDAGDLNPNDIPVGPQTIARALADALNGQFSRVETKQRVARALCRHLPDPIDLLYRDLGAHLDSSRQAAAPGEMSADASVEARTRESAAGASPARPPIPADAARPARTIPDGALAAAAAAAEVARATAVRRLPRVILEFLAGPWQRLLAMIHGSRGPESADWRDAVKTMDDLVWSLSARTAREERASLVRVLPDLVKRLGEGLDRLGTPYDGRGAFFASLSRYHIKLLTLPGPAEGDAQSRPEPVEAPTPQAPECLPPDPAATPAERSDAALDRLVTGTWIEFDEGDGARVALKVSWISAGGKLYLLMNRQGKRALSLNAAELTGHLLQGKARVISPPESDAPALDLPSTSRKTA